MKESAPDNDVETWIARISSEEMPAFAHTARSLAYVSRNDDASANDLANVILHDAAMTARVLRLANSVRFNVGGQPIETVSYAIVILGFEQVRDMALTIAMIDSILDSKYQFQVQNEMVCAFHAAIQARRLAQETSPEKLEAVYIKALLHRLGPTMFWCYPLEKGEELLKSYAAFKEAEAAERHVLGFSLRELTTGLVSKWHLDTIVDNPNERDATSSNAKAVALGQTIAHAAAKGWNSDSLQQEITEVAKHLNISPREAREFIVAGAKRANEGLLSFGFPQTGALLPPDESEPKNRPAIKEEKPSQHELELRIMRQLSHMLSKNMDLNKVIMAVLEGIYRVLEMEDVVFAVVDNKTKSLAPKFMIGKRRDSIMRTPFREQRSGAFIDYLHSLDEAHWQRSGQAGYHGEVDPLIRQLGDHEYFIAPIKLAEKVLGAVYANRAGGAPLTEMNLQSFSHLSEYVVLAFKILASVNPATR